MAFRRDWTQPQPGGQGFMRTGKVFGRKVNLLTTDLVASGVVGCFILPPHFGVIGLYGVSGDLDGGAGLVFSLGEPGMNNRFLSNSAAGQNGDALPPMAATGFNFRTFSETEVQFTVNVSAATPQAGVLEFYLYGAIFA